MEENTNINETNAGIEEAGAEQNAVATATEQTYTAEEVQKMIDRAVQKGVETNTKKLEKKYAKERSLQGLDEVERLKQESANRIAELEEALAELNIENNRKEIRSVLNARGLDGSFADILIITDDLEESQANIQKLDVLFKKAVKDEVERRLAASGGTPKGAGTNVASSDKKKFEDLSTDELAALWKRDPHQYELMRGDF